MRLNPPGKEVNLIFISWFGYLKNNEVLIPNSNMFQEERFYVF